MHRSAFVLLLFIIGGAMVGSILNEVLTPILPVLKHAAGGGLSPATLNLGFFSITFGVSLRLTLGTALGIAGALVAYRRF